MQQSTIMNMAHVEFFVVFFWFFSERKREDRALFLADAGVVIRSWVKSRMEMKSSVYNFGFSHIHQLLGKARLLSCHMKTSITLSASIFEMVSWLRQALTNSSSVTLPSESTSISLKALLAMVSWLSLSGLSSFLNKWKRSFTIRPNSFWDTEPSLLMSKMRNICKNKFWCFSFLEDF